MPVRTPRVTIITRREGKRVALSVGVPVELTNAEIAHLERDSPGALAPVRPEDAAPSPDNKVLVIPAETADAENPGDEPETEEERLAREAVERAKAGKTPGKAPGKGKAGKPASGDADGL